MEFTPINTQEEFNEAIKERLARAEASVRREYSDYDALKQAAASHEAAMNQANEKIKAQATTIGELEAKVKGYETDSAKTRIALRLGLPYELAGRLTGETEKDIQADAESLAKLMGAGQTPPPLRSTEPAGDKRAALKKLRADLLEE